MDSELLLHQLFEQQEERTPDRVAVAMGQRTLTYTQLNHRANVLAGSILAYCGANEIIAISGTRCIEAVVAILAILKAGKCYVVLDPAVPLRRLQYIIADSGIDTCICLENEFPFYESLGIATLDYNSVIISSDWHGQKLNTLACVYYVPDAHGNAKGVATGHASLVNMVSWQCRNMVAGFKNVLQLSPLAAELAVQEIFVTLSCGSTLHIADEYAAVDPFGLLHLLTEKQIERLFVTYTNLTIIAASVNAGGKLPAVLKEVFVSGQQLTITTVIADLFAALNGAVLHNQYKITEGQLLTQHTLSGNPYTWPVKPPIGRPIDGCSVHIIDSHSRKVPPGISGNLCIGGSCLAKGYLNEPELDEHRFFLWKSPSKRVVRLFKTGEIAHINENDELELGERTDSQFVIDGFRIDTREIEAALMELDGVEQVTVHIATDHHGHDRTVALVKTSERTSLHRVREEATELIPEWMLPSWFIPDGKLKPAENRRVDFEFICALVKEGLAARYFPPASQEEHRIQKAWTDVLGVANPGVTVDFFQCGGNVQRARELVIYLRKQFSIITTVADICSFTTIREFSQSLSDKETNKRLGGNGREHKTEIAIIGFGAHLCNTNELNDKDWAYFDADYFGMSEIEATLLDPQQRLFLETANEALEMAGYAHLNAPQAMGVFAGCAESRYLLEQIIPDGKLVRQQGWDAVLHANEKDYLACRVAETLQLSGPVVSIQSGKATGLLAIAKAAVSIRSGKCEAAIAGAASIQQLLPGGGHRVYQDGAAVLLLKSRSAAERDGDTILALLKDTLIANWNTAAGTEKGIEELKIKASKLRSGDTQPIVIALAGELSGSENLVEQALISGDLSVAPDYITDAGATTGMEVIVDSLRDIVQENVGNISEPALHTHPIACVATAGAGTAVALFWEPYTSMIKESGVSRKNELFCWSAGNPDSLHMYGMQLAAFANNNPDLNPGDLAFSLQIRRHYHYRRFAVAGSISELVPRILAAEFVSATSAYSAAGFLFPGTGQHFQRMGWELYRSEAVYRTAIDECAVLLLDDLGEDIRKTIFSAQDTPSVHNSLNNQYYSVPSVFVTSYALGRMFMAWGIKPALVAGQGVGEIAAAYFAGIFGLHDALRIVTVLARLAAGIADVPSLHAWIAKDEIAPILPAGLSVAGTAAGCSVLSGQAHVLNAFCRVLDSMKIRYEKTDAAQPLHTALAAEIVPPLKVAIAAINTAPPHVPLYSFSVGRQITEQEAQDPDFWATVFRNPVLDSETVGVLNGIEQVAYLECGPGNYFSKLFQTSGTGRLVLPLLEEQSAVASGQSGMDALGRLWQAGIEPDWQVYHHGRNRNKVLLPAYAFNRSRYWIDTDIQIFTQDEPARDVPVPVSVLVPVVVPVADLIADPVAPQPLMPIHESPVAIVAEVNNTVFFPVEPTPDVHPYSVSNEPEEAVSLPFVDLKHMAALFYDSAGRNGGATALKFNDISYSYNELNESSNQLAGVLMVSGLRPGQVAGLLMERNAQMVITALAILKTGAALMFLDKEPAAWQIKLLELANCDLVITEKALAGNVAGEVRKVVIEDILPRAGRYSRGNHTHDIPMDAVAYLHTTLGNSGLAVVTGISQESCSRTLMAIKVVAGLKDSDHILSCNNVVHHFFLLEVMSAFINGACLSLTAAVPANTGARRLLEFASQSNITFLFATQALAVGLAQQEVNSCRALSVICSALTIQHEDRKLLSNRFRALYLVYGYPAVGLCSSIAALKNDDLQNIGKIVYGADVAVLDNDLNNISTGKPGGIYIGGSAIGQQIPTGTDFVEIISAIGIKSLAYKTGDIGVATEAGHVRIIAATHVIAELKGKEFYLRGVGQAVLKMKYFADAEAVIHNGRLFLFVVPVEAATSNLQLGQHDAARLLPGWLLPDVWIAADKIYRNSVGNVDMQQMANLLPVAAVAAAANGINGETESAVAEIWSDLLKCKVVNGDSDFFELGGSRAIAILATLALGVRLGKKLLVSGVQNHSTVKEWSSWADQQNAVSDQVNINNLKVSGKKAKAYIFSVEPSVLPAYASVIKHMDQDQPVFQLQFRIGPAFAENTAVEDIASECVLALLQHNPGGPYCIFGHADAAAVAFETARQLVAMNRIVKLLGIIDGVAGTNSTGDPVKKQGRQFGLFGGLLGAKQESASVDMTEIAASQLFRKYMYPAYDGIIDLFRFKTRHYNHSDSQFLGWRQCTKVGIKVHELPADRQTFTDTPVNKEIAAILQKAIDEAK